MIRKCLFAALALAAVALPAAATDVYVYASGNLKPLVEMVNVRKIVHDGTTTMFISTKGDTVKLGYTTLNYITTHRTSIPVGVKSARSRKLTISREGGAVRVVADAKLRSVAVMTTGGETVARLAPASADVIISTDGMPAGVYIITAETAAGDKATKKIVKK